jgi:hypothetical protein
VTADLGFVTVITGWTCIRGGGGCTTICLRHERVMPRQDVQSVTGVSIRITQFLVTHTSQAAEQYRSESHHQIRIIVNHGQCTATHGNVHVHLPPPNYYWYHCISHVKLDSPSASNSSRQPGVGVGFKLELFADTATVGVWRQCEWVIRKFWPVKFHYWLRNRVETHFSACWSLWLRVLWYEAIPAYINRISCLNTGFSY